MEAIDNIVILFILLFSAGVAVVHLIIRYVFKLKFSIVYVLVLLGAVVVVLWLLSIVFDHMTAMPNLSGAQMEGCSKHLLPEYAVGKV